MTNEQRPEPDLPQIDEHLNRMLKERDDYKRYLQQPTFPPQGYPCPSCGHCPTCGRGTQRFYPTYPTLTWTSGYIAPSATTIRGDSEK